MAKRYSVADARKHLPELLDQVQSGRAVEITRRGEPIAVLVSLAEFRRAQAKPGALRLAVEAWRSSWSDEDREVDAGFFEALRDRSPAREVDL